MTAASRPRTHACAPSVQVRTAASMRSTAKFRSNEPACESAQFKCPISARYCCTIASPKASGSSMLGSAGYIALSALTALDALISSLRSAALMWCANCPPTSSADKSRPPLASTAHLIGTCRPSLFCCFCTAVFSSSQTRDMAFRSSVDTRSGTWQLCARTRLVQAHMNCGSA